MINLIPMIPKLGNLQQYDIYALFLISKCQFEFWKDILYKISICEIPFRQILGIPPDVRCFLITMVMMLMIRRIIMSVEIYNTLEIWHEDSSNPDNVTTFGDFVSLSKMVSKRRTLNKNTMNACSENIRYK